MSAWFQEWLCLFYLKVGSYWFDEVGILGAGEDGITVNFVEPGSAGRSRASRSLSLHQRSQSRGWHLLGRRGRRKREMDRLICFGSTSGVPPW